MIYYKLAYQKELLEYAETVYDLGDKFQKEELMNF